MIRQFWIRLAELSLVLLLVSAVILAWREARADRLQLQTQLAAANQALAAATARQQDRDAKLNDVLTNIAAEKKAATTPAQLLAGIASEAGLAMPLTLQSAPAPIATAQSKPPRSCSTGTLACAPSDNAEQSAVMDAHPKGNGSPTGEASPSAPSQPSTGAPQAQSTATPQLPTAPDAKIPAADLQPLYNYLLDCKACQAKLTAAQADLADEKSKTATLTKSRDDAIRAAKGGSILQRTARALKWLAIGAAAGAIAAKTVR